MFESEKLAIGDNEKETILKSFELDDKSIAEFRSKIKKCSLDEANKKGELISKELGSEYAECISMKKIKALLLEGANVNYQDEEGNALLMLASSIDIIALLLRAGADINVRNKEGRTALFKAVEYDNYSGCLLFLIFGADINHRDIEGNTPLLSAFKKYPSKVRFIKDLFRETRIKTIKLLIDNNAYLNITNIFGESITDFFTEEWEKEYFDQFLTFDKVNDLDEEIRVELEEAKKCCEAVWKGVNLTSSFTEEKDKELKKTFKRV